LIKRLLVVTVVMALLAMPLSLFAKSANQFSIGKIDESQANTIVVPLEISNEANLVALDIPLKFSDGVTLKEVNFDNTRIDYFDFKIAHIDNENNTVVIGAMPQMSPNPKPDLSEGTGVIANLVFELTDPSVTSVKLEAVEMTDPSHELMFVYHDYNADGSIAAIRPEYPEFGSVVANSNSGNDLLPTVYSLEQNYPNPFNPSTDISFALPAASHVKLTVYNVLGQEVETLADQQMEAGVHTLTWQANDYSSGVYFYRLSAVANGQEQFTKTQKMMLLK
jgi:hypothetical protein